MLLLVGFCIPLGVQAQAPKKVSIEGTVTEYNTKEPIAGCVVSIPTLELWVVTDAKGRFRMPSVTTGSYTIEATCLGYEPLSYKVTITASIGALSLRLKESSLQLNTVTVTAQRGRSINSSSTIDRQAMVHLQATSVKDVMQLLPGVVTSNPDLTSSSYNFIGIRDLNPNMTSVETLGVNSSTVGIYVDGASVKNDASLVGEKATGFGQPVSKGIDMRTISTDNIESVEVVRGVASAEYGNMSAGAVIVKTKQGRTPYEVRVKAVPNTKAVALTKGYALGPDKGFLNVGLDYANAMKDIRTSKDAYDRGTFSVNYSNTFNRDRTPFQFNAKVSGYLSKGTSKPDADDLSQDERKFLDDKSLSLNLNGSWLLNKSWITSLKYVLSHTMTREYARNKALSTFVGVANPGATEPGEGFVEFTPHDYMSDIRNLSMAYYTNAKLMAEVSGRYGKVYNKAMLGAEWSNSGNTGKGQYYEGVRPIQFRPQPFSDIPFMNQVAVFVEEKVTLPVGKTSLTLQAGGRFTYLATDRLNDKWAVDPRFNLKYTIISNRAPKKVRELSLRAGWGIQTTLPGLYTLYPFASYIDNYSLRLPAAGERPAMEAWTTEVTTAEELSNRDLKMQYSKNFEVGVDFEMFGIKGSIAYYNEKMRNGYSTMYTPGVYSYREYNYSGAETPVYIDDPNNPGQKVLGVNGEPLDYETVTKFKRIAKPGNNNKYDKQGVEYTFDFGQIRAIRTSIIVNGAYMQMKNMPDVGVKQLFDLSYNSGKIQINGENVYNPVYGGYDGGKSLQGTAIRKRFNSNFSFITHIPKLRLITSLTVQCVWLDRSRSFKNSGVYYEDAEGNKIYDFEGQVDGTLYKDPDWYMDAAGNVLPFDPSLYDGELGNAFQIYRTTSTNSSLFVQNSFKPYFMANIRITKEIGNIAQISFYANNFTNSRPKMKLQSTGSYRMVNTEMYFGAELKLKF